MVSVGDVWNHRLVRNEHQGIEKTENKQHSGEIEDFGGLTELYIEHPRRGSPHKHPKDNRWPNKYQNKWFSSPVFAG